MLVLFRGHFGRIFGITLGVICGRGLDHFGIVLRTCWDRFVIMMGSLWGHLGYFDVNTSSLNKHVALNRGLWDFELHAGHLGEKAP